jgi:flavin-dependent dehydrogenase
VRAAGASAATYLSRAGMRVLLLDFQSYPRDKVCGDFVGPITIRNSTDPVYDVFLTGNISQAI